VNLRKDHYAIFWMPQVLHEARIVLVKD
jgi:hypothetical protein